MKLDSQPLGHLPGPQTSSDAWQKHTALSSDTEAVPGPADNGRKASEWADMGGPGDGGWEREDR